MPFPFANLVHVPSIFRAGKLASDEGRPLEVEELPELPHSETAEACADEFDEIWSSYATECRAAGKAPSLAYMLFKGYKCEFISGFLIRVTYDGAAIGQAFILRELIRWLEDPKNGTHNAWEGYLLGVGVALISSSMPFLLGLVLEVSSMEVSRMRSALHVLIFRKALRLDADPSKVGQITALHSSDVAKLKDNAFMHSVTSAPLMLIANTVALYFVVGYAGLIVVALLLISTVIQVFCANGIGKIMGGFNKICDGRIQAVNEVLENIRVCKFMHWEKRFEERIEEHRSNELVALRRLLNYRAAFVGLTHATPIIIQVLLFAIAYWLDEPISGPTVFPAIALLNTLRAAIGGVAFVMSRLVELKVSLDRVGDFLLLDEREVLGDQSETTMNDDTPAVLLKGVTVGFMKVPKADEAATETDEKEKKEKEEKEKSKRSEYDSLSPVVPPHGEHREFHPLLSDVSLEIQRGKLTIITGKTGSGKSLLVQTLMNESHVSGFEKFSLNAEIAYVPQEAWIMNATVKQNITLAIDEEQQKEVDDDHYVKSVEACQLLDDFDQLPSADETEIGEQGVNLSGGQKQRLAFARAVYSGREMVLMDDPLSAVDSHVCKALFHECICDALAGKTRVLVTHQTQFLPFADHIIMMKDCHIEFSGSYKEFAEQHLENEIVDSPTNGKDASPLSYSPASPHSKGKKQARAERAEEANGNAGIGGTNDLGTSQKPAAAQQIQPERIHFGVIGASIYGWYFKLGGLGNFVSVMLFFTLYRAGMLLTDMWLAAWTSRSEMMGRSSYTSNEYLLFFAITGLCTIVLIAVRSVFMNFHHFGVSENIHRNMLRNLLRAPISFFDTTPMGRILSRFTKDLMIIDLVLPDMGQFFLFLIFFCLGIIIFVCVSAFYVVPLVLLLVFFYYLVSIYFTATVRGIRRLENTTRSPAMSIFHECISGIVTVRAYKLTDHFDLVHCKRIDRMMRTLFSNRTSILSQLFFVALFSLLLTVSLCCLAVVFKTNSDAAKVSPGGNIVALAVTYCIVVGVQLGFGLLIFAEIDSNFNSVERIKEYTDEIEQERDVTYDGDYGAPDATNPRPPKDWPSAGCIDFSNVCMRYRDGLPLVLKSLSFSVKGGYKVGIVGRTGSGKSSIMLTLFRLIELSDGKISLDGVDIAGLSLEDLRTNVTIIPQDPVLFAGTVRVNLDPFSEYTDDEITSILKDVGLLERIERDGVGLEAEVKTKGTNFSQGQKQLMCLARALLQKSKILLLDEATASVDYEADAMIQRVLRTAFANVTVLTVAHRLATVIDSDRILVLSDGSLAEFDSPYPLLQNSDSLFYDMVANLGEEQFKSLLKVAKDAYDAKKEKE